MRMLTCLMLFTACCHAETYRFGTGEDAFEMEFVDIGDAGNLHDARTTPPMGAVDYEFQMAKFEVSCRMQRTASVAGAFDEPFGTRDEICRAVSEASPVVFSWVESAQFVNWLNLEAGYPVAYKLNDSDASGTEVRLEDWGPDEPGYNPENPERNSLARFVIPDTDEWHKAAYFDPSEGVYRLYATGDTPPVKLGPEGGTEPNTANYDSVFGVDVDKAGGLSAFGTMGQTGNAQEWEEGQFTAEILKRAIRIGADADLAGSTAINSRTTRFSDLAALRVAAVTPVPEPSSLTLFAFVLCALGAIRRLVI